MGHAGAIINNAEETVEAKIKVLKECGIHVCDNLGDIADVINKTFKEV
jgi:succinyl-CoA synthetase alpha subunit